MLGGNKDDLQKLAIILGIGGVLGYLVADKYNKSKGLGFILGAGATLGSMYAFKLNVRDIFDGKNKKGLSGQIPTNALVRPFIVNNDCLKRYSELSQPAVMMPPEYWKKREEDWMKINCK